MESLFPTPVLHPVHPNFQRLSTPQLCTTVLHVVACASGQQRRLLNTNYGGTSLHFTASGIHN